MINNQLNEITLIYNSDKANNKKAKGYVESFPGKTIKVLDLNKDSLTEKQLTEVATKLGGNIEDLLDPSYDDHISVHREGLKIMGRLEMRTLMTHDAKLIDTPILIVGKKAYKAGSAYDFMKKEMVGTVAA